MANPSPAIKHVVIIIQENRSLNTIFGGPSPFPNATTSSFGYEHDGTRVNLSSISLADSNPDIDHFYQDAITALNALPSGPYQMNGFDQERRVGGGNAGKFPYKYVNYSETKPYWFMASHWVLGDEFFPTEFGGSFTAHLNLIAGTDEIMHNQAVVDFPTSWAQTKTGCEAPSGSTVPFLEPGQYIQQGPYPCFWEFATMADLLDNSGIDWRYYAPKLSNPSALNRLWSEFVAIERVRCGTTGPISQPCTQTGPDWANVVSPTNQILSDVKAGVLKGVTWVVPTWTNSDHQGSQSTSGPAWVASIVNTIGNSSFWNKTVIIVLWDDWGGWYDESPPQQYDFRGKGIRTPVIVISPYAKTCGAPYYNGGCVSHFVYEPGSILRLIENVFNLGDLNSLNFCSYCGTLGYTDDSAKNGMGDGTLDFTQTPRPFTPVPTPPGRDVNYFMLQPQSSTAPDDE